MKNNKILNKKNSDMILKIKQWTYFENRFQIWFSIWKIECFYKEISVMFFSMKNRMFFTKRFQICFLIWKIYRFWNKSAKSKIKDLILDLELIFMLMNEQCLIYSYNHHVNKLIMAVWACEEIMWKI